jgi:hypothetical protein
LAHGRRHPVSLSTGPVTGVQQPPATQATDIRDIDLPTPLSVYSARHGGRLHGSPPTRLLKSRFSQSTFAMPDSHPALEICGVILL